MNKTAIKEVPAPLAWELDARSTRFIFEAAKDKAAENIKKIRWELIMLEHYDPIPQTCHDGKPAMFDQKTKVEIIEEKKQWLRYYEHIHQFCLRVDERIMHVEAEKFGEQIAEFFKNRKE